MKNYSISVFSKPIQGQVDLPGSKSLTNRALVLAALSQGEVTLKNPLWSDDTECMIQALRSLGYTLSENKTQSKITVIGEMGHIPNSTTVFNVKNAGTVARFLPALCALRVGGHYTFETNSPAMKSRPMQGLLQALEAMGAKLFFLEKPYSFPFIMKTSGLHASQHLIDASQSSQILSALLLVLPYVQGERKLFFQEKRVSEAMLNLTCAMMKQWGVEVIINKRSFEIKQESSKCYGPSASVTEDFRISKIYSIEPDATAASYFASLVAICGGKLTLNRVSKHLLQPDLRYFDILKDLTLITSQNLPEGLQIKAVGINRAKNGSIPNLHNETIEKNKKNDIKAYDFNTISDTFMSLAAIAPVLPYPIHFKNIQHARYKETDRIHAVVTELRKLGQDVEEAVDSLIVKSSTIEIPPSIATYEDHRMAMSFAILGSYDLLGNGQSWLKLENPACCKKTFPSFFQVLESLKK